MGRSPRDRVPVAIEEGEPRLALTAEQDVNDLRHAVLNAERCLWTAEPGANPARCHQHQRARIIGMARGVAPEELVEGRLAAAANLVKSVDIVRDAALKT